MRFIDTHCHLDQAEFDSDREDVIRRAVTQEIVVITSATSIESYDRTLDIAQVHEGVYAALGLDPQKHWQVGSALGEIQAHASDIVAIGETGLDHFLEREHELRHEQEMAFEKMIHVSKELGLPLQVHSRSAGRAALLVLEKNDAQMVHMHAFDGKASLARKATKELGYYFSIPTSVVRSPQKRKLVKAIEIERLLLETDSPVLGPDREVRNEPAHLPIALREVSSILGREEEELQEIILENTLRLYTKIRERQNNS